MARNTSWHLIEKILSGTATAREQRAFQRWLQEDARHPPIFEELQQAWNRLPQRFDPLLAYEKLQGELVPTRNRPRRGWRYNGVAAALVLLLVAGGLFYSYRTEIINQLHPVAYCSVSVSPGSRQQVQLTDGTKIYLNAGSQLRYPTRFRPDQRQVFLKGEGYFEVTPDPARPFLIQSGGLITRVLGTSFNLQAYPEDGAHRVTVVSGSVQVSHPTTAQHTVLQPGEQAVYSAKEQVLTRVSVPDASVSSAWTDGTLMFDNTPLPEVIMVLNRKYDVHIQLANERLNNCRIFGSFKRPSLETTLEVVCQSLNASCRYQGREIVINGNGCE